MRALDGRLRIDTKYELVSMYYGTLEDNASICENCGKLIANMADIKDEDGKVFTVGQDCCEELLKVTNSDFWKFMQDKKAYNKKRSFVQKYKKAVKEDMVTVEEDFIYFYNWGNGYKRINGELVITKEKIWSTRYRIEYAKSVLAEFRVIV